MKSAVLSFVVGFIFAVGLGISGMTQPTKVVGFLDLFGDWDPSLMFVMVGAIGVHFVSFRFIRKLPTPLVEKQWHLPSKTELTPSLIIGAVLFGMGWALGGYCPGPAVSSLGSLDPRPFYFVLSMLAGMVIFKGVNGLFKFNR